MKVRTMLAWLFVFTLLLLAAVWRDGQLSLVMQFIPNL